MRRQIEVTDAMVHAAARAAYVVGWTADGDGKRRTPFELLPEDVRVWRLREARAALEAGLDAETTVPPRSILRNLMRDDRLQ